MNSSKAYWLDSAYVLPERSLSSLEIEEELRPFYQKTGLYEGRLELLTGVINRRVYGREILSSSPSIAAAKKLQERFDFDQVDYLIHASVCKDQLEPATAASIHAHLNLKNTTPFFDLSNACLGMLQAVHLASQWVECGLAKLILIVGGENSGPLIEDTIKKLNEIEHPHRQDLKKYLANLTLGSGGAAILIGGKEFIEVQKNRAKWCLGSRVIEVDSSSHELCKGGTMMETDSVKLLHQGLLLAERTWSRFNSKNYSLIIPHQVGKVHSVQLFQLLNLDLNLSFSTFEFLGNTGSLALPITFERALEANRDSEHVLFLGIGSGLSCLIMDMEQIK